MLKMINRWLWLVLVLFTVVGLTISPLIGYLALICMLGPVITAFFKGRFWCGWLCPRGSLFDHLLAPLSVKKKIPAFLKQMPTRIFFLILVMSIFAIQIYNNWGNTLAVASVFLRMIIVTTIVGIILGIFIHPRTWCSFCPMGTLATLVSKKVKKSPQKAISL